MKLATLCYVKHNNKTLMLHRIKKQGDIHLGKWNGLGGKCQHGETPEECVIREVFEESGLQIVSPKLHGIITFPLFQENEDWYVFVFTAKEFSGTMIDSPEGHLEWIDDNKILSLSLWEGDRIFLLWLEKQEFFSAKFEYKKEKLISYSVVFHN